jgi:hypothetical protein
MRIHFFLIEESWVGRWGIKRLIIGIVLHVLDINFFPKNFFWFKLIFVFRASIKRYAFTLIFDSRDNLFSHLRFLPRIMLSIWAVDVIVWSILWSF